MIFAGKIPHVTTYCFTQKDISSYVNKLYMFSSTQCRCGTDWGLHHAKHRAGADALRGCGGHLPNGQNAENATASNGANRGESLELLFYCRSSCLLAHWLAI